MRKPAFCICENQDADQLRVNREGDQRLCFRYSDSTIPLLPKSEIQVPSHPLWQYSPVCVGPGRKPRRPVFSQRGSFLEASDDLMKRNFCVYQTMYSIYLIMNTREKKAGLCNVNAKNIYVSTLVDIFSETRPKLLTYFKFVCLVN